MQSFVKWFFVAIGSWLAVTSAVSAQIKVNRAAPWEKKNFVAPQAQQIPGFNQLCGGLGTSKASSVLCGGAEWMKGNGLAYDQCLGAESQTAVSASASLLESWQYVGSKIGHLEGFAKLTGSGEASLIDPECAALAAGALEYRSSSGIQESIYLDKSAGETTQGLLGTVYIDLRFMGFSIPVVAGIGDFDRFDEMEKYFYEGGCTRYWKRESYAQGKIQVWANGGLFSIGEAAACLDLKASGTIVLSELPPEECP
ncbi:MAG: hypothetical protein DWQ01_18540 [Planctomycetota bacterium]|nr:MAG: hypothetical protein DWQ01_18540 [Planctomycetota bacterium]